MAENGKIDPPLSEAFSVMADLHMARGHKGLNKLTSPFVLTIDEHWRTLTNATKEPVTSEDGDEIPPFSALVFYGDLPVGFINPYGGALLSGAEDDFIAAVKTQIEIAND